MRAEALIESIAVYEDAGYGACFLRDERIIELVENTLFFFNGERYRLLAWCIMPNHVHDLIEMMPGFPLGAIVHSGKSFTAKQANQILGTSGEFWMEDYFDRYIRNEDHLQCTIDCIEQNPVKAGLAANAADWKYSSARCKGARALFSNPCLAEFWTPTDRPSPGYPSLKKDA